MMAMKGFSALAEEELYAVNGGRQAEGIYASGKEDYWMKDYLIGQNTDIGFGGGCSDQSYKYDALLACEVRTIVGTANPVAATILGVVATVVTVCGN